MRNHTNRPEITVKKVCSSCQDNKVKSTCYVVQSGLFWFNCNKCDSTLAVQENQIDSLVEGLEVNHG